MKKRQQFLLLLAVAAFAGGIAGSGQVHAADAKVEVLKTPEQAVEKMAAANTNGSSAKAKARSIKNEKAEREEAIESRILLRVKDAPEDLQNVRKAYYYEPGSYYILQYSSSEAAETAKAKWVQLYGEKKVVQDRPVYQEDDGENEEVVPFDGIHMMGMDTLKTRAKDWKGSVKVAVVDSGADRDHKLLAGRIDEKNSINLSGYEPESAFDDTYGHGSHVSGIITQATPDQVKIMAVRVFDDFQMSSLSRITMGIDYAREHGADVVNMSLGHTSPTRAEKDLIDASMRKSVEEGETLVAAAGNENNNVSTSCPANSSWTISVGSVQPSETDENVYVRSWFSNYGERLDFTAPGNQIDSAWADGSNQVVSGTSMATPHIAAAAAMIRLKNPQYDQWEIYSELQDNAVDLGPVGKDDEYGYGYVYLGDYGEKEVTGPVYQSVSADATTKKTMNEVGQIFDLHVKLLKGDGALSYETSDPSVATVKDGKFTVKGAGKCNIIITASETAAYKETKRTVQIEIVKGKQTIELPKTVYRKTTADKAFRLEAKVKKPGDGKITFVANDNPVLRVSAKGVVTIKGAGTAKVYAIASGTESFEEATSNAITIQVTKEKKITLAKASIRKTKKYKKAAGVYWNKVKNADGYEIRYSLKSSMKQAKVKKSTKTSCKITKLRSKKKYYIQVRAYTKKTKEKIYGNWSSKKSVRVK